MRKRIFSVILAGVLTLSLAACGSNGTFANDSTSSSVAEIETSSPSESEQAADEDSTSFAQAETSGKTLIVYFSPSNSDTVDAVTSATPRVGDTSAVEYLAQLIESSLDADIAKIVPDNAYSVVYDEAADQAKAEKDNDERPTFSLDVNPEEYDTIFAGYPIWWYGFPMVMETFFDTYDFSGKTIIPFNTHLGSRDGGTHAEIAELEPEATVLEGLAINADDVADSDDDVSEWLAGLGY